uniref:Uncharacterized protein n=1 Tax=Janthinobacterium lividum TaxID=29581 RepID=A0SYW5_9BURK|nr:hypothetical protein [Janthinobacterium lividum]
MRGRLQSLLYAMRRQDRGKRIIDRKADAAEQDAGAAGAKRDVRRAAGLIDLVTRPAGAAIPASPPSTRAARAAWRTPSSGAPSARGAHRASRTPKSPDATGGCSCRPANSCARGRHRRQRCPRHWPCLGPGRPCPRRQRRSESARAPGPSGRWARPSAPLFQLRPGPAEDAVTP